jgi:hypothetical protein
MDTHVCGEEIGVARLLMGSLGVTVQDSFPQWSGFRVWELVNGVGIDSGLGSRVYTPNPNPES